MTDPLRQALRQTCQLVRKKLPPDFQRHASNRICAQIRQIEAYRYAKRIALYHAIHGEVNVHSIWRSAPLQGKYCYFPVLNDNLTLAFLPATPLTPFSKNRFGIQEPTVGREHALDPQKLDLLLMPLVLFDLDGTRVGMGEGYYDRTLAESPRPMLMGVAYEFQRQSWLMSAPWDIPLDVIITEKANYWRKP
ncbi:MAG: 5-formyltetrahydrofolate cyclo-ligase [Legionellales bacterium]|nr:5-formyltetrahydrofolate cyclo-ligase [Legionellales bacterium]